MIGINVGLKTNLGLRETQNRHKLYETMILN